MSQPRRQRTRNHSWTSDNDTNLSHRRLIGLGGFAEVHEMFDNTQNRSFARKVIRIMGNNITDDDIDKEVDAIAQICTTGHGNIVQILRHDWFSSGSVYFIDMELCALNLHDYIYRTQEYIRRASVLSNNRTFVIEDASTHLKLINIWTIMDHVAQGLQFIHEKNYIHRDLKPLNILYSSNGNVWKIADFGLTVEGTSKRAITTVYSRGTEGYRAPELLLDNPKFSSKVDIWALGCILYELASGEKAFASDLQARDFSFSQSTLPVSIPFFPENFVMHISECINKMLGKKAQDRSPISTIRLLLRQKMAAADQVRGEVVITMTVEEREKLNWALLDAAKAGNEDDVKILLRSGAEVDSKDDEGRTPLSYAAENGHVEVVRLLVRAGAKVDIRHKYGRTPLSWAAGKSHVEVVTFLVKEAGAEVDLSSDWSQTPLSWAAENGHVEVVRWLVAEGKAEVDANDCDGHTPLSWAAANGHMDVVRWLVAEGKAEVDSKSNWRDQTPLTRAAKNGHVDVVRWLALERGAEVDLRDRDGWTPLSHAALNGHVETVKWLVLEGKAEVDTKDERQMTPLSYAAYEGHVEVVRFLVLEAGAEVDSKDEWRGLTPLSWAKQDYQAESGLREQEKEKIRKGKREVVEFLEKWKRDHGDRS